MADIAKKRVKSRQARHARIRRKVSGTSELPRLCVRRSLKGMIAQIVNDEENKSLLQMTTTAKDFQAKFSSVTKTEQAKELGKVVGEAAKKMGIETIAFDRGGFIYHGRVKAFAEGARDSGLKF